MAAVELTIAGLTVEPVGRITLERVSVSIPEDVRAVLDRLGADAELVESFLQDVADVAVYVGASDAVALIRGGPAEAAPYRRQRAGFGARR